MKKKWSLLLVLMLILSLLAAGCSGNGTPDSDVDPDDEVVEQEPGEDIDSDDTSLSDVLAKGVLIVGCDDSFPPMGFVDEATGEVVGFDIDLAKAVAEELGVEIQVQPIDWKTKEMTLASGMIDVIWNGYTITPERNDQVEYTKPYLNNEQVVVVPVDSDVQTLADLEGKMVGAQEESAGREAIDKNKAFSDAVEGVTEYADYMTSLLDLGVRTEAVVVDRVLIGYVMSQQPGTYRILDESLGDEFYGIGCREGEVALRIAIDDALDRLMSNGVIDEISGEWFGENIVIRNVEKLTNDQIPE